jgi:hypothetical protein
LICDSHPELRVCKQWSGFGNGGEKGERGQCGGEELEVVVDKKELEEEEQVDKSKSRGNAML